MPNELSHFMCLFPHLNDIFIIKFLIFWRFAVTFQLLIEYRIYGSSITCCSYVRIKNVFTEILMANFWRLFTKMWNIDQTSHLIIHSIISYNKKYPYAIQNTFMTCPILSNNVGTLPTIQRDKIIGVEKIFTIMQCTFPHSVLLSILRTL